MDTLKEVLTGIPWYGWIAIVAIMAGTVKKVIGMTQRHEERLEQIRNGMDPGPVEDD